MADEQTPRQQLATIVNWAIHSGKATMAAHSLVRAVVEEEMAPVRAIIDQGISDMQALANMVGGDETLEEMVHHHANNLGEAMRLIDQRPGGERPESPKRFWIDQRGPRALLVAVGTSSGTRAMLNLMSLDQAPSEPSAWNVSVDHLSELRRVMGARGYTEVLYDPRTHSATGYLYTEADDPTKSGGLI